jgi:hypothetical protein
MIWSRGRTELPSGSVGKRGRVRYAAAIELLADAP